MHIPVFNITGNVWSTRNVLLDLVCLIFQSVKNKTLVFGHVKLYTCSEGFIIYGNGESGV